MPDYFATVLIMEDDADYASLIRRTFINAGHRVVFASDSPTAFANCSKNQIALALIDINASRWDGVTLSLALQDVVGVPVIALVQAEMTRRQVHFLVEEAEDYITKPFTANELFLRAAPFLRKWRCDRQPDSLTTVGDLILNNANDRLWVCDRSSILTPNEYRLLSYFMQRPNQTLHKAELILAVWENHFHNEENALRVLVGRLRKKIERDVSHPTRLLTVQNIGYRLQTASPLLDAKMQTSASFHPALPISQQNLRDASSFAAGGRPYHANIPP